MTTRQDENLRSLDDAMFLEKIKEHASGRRVGYKAFYSSFLQGITTHVHHMMVPLDDHMVHRGDAVFEAAKFTDGGVFALDRHLDRLWVSAQAIALPMPETKSALREIVLATIRASGLRTGLIRLYIARGPGGFTANPYETIGTQVYCAITTSQPLAAEKYQNGVRTGRSKLAVKEGFFANTKSCNYLPNVLMKKESVDRGLDFVVTLDEQGFVAEGSTENFALISESGALLVPSFERVLKGVTILRALELAREGGISTENRRFKEDEVLNAKGALMAGTTIDLLPVASYEDHIFKKSDGSVVPDELRALMQAFQNDLQRGPLVTAIG